MTKWSDRKTAVIASSIFLASVAGSFAIAIAWNVVLFSTLCIFVGLGTAILLISAADEPNHDI